MTKKLEVEMIRNVTNHTMRTIKNFYTLSSIC